MFRLTCRLGLLLLLALPIMSCSSTRVSNPSDVVTVNFTAITDDPATGEPVIFVLVGSASLHSITASRIDYDGDGTWDDSLAHTGPVVAAQYSHIYNTAGSYLARAEILEDAEILGSATTSVTVTDPGVILDVVSLDNPPVTAVVDQNSCTLVIEDWTASMQGVPTTQQPSSPFHDITLHDVTITYDWDDPTILTPARVFGLGDVTIASGQVTDVTFPPISFDDLEAVMQGHTCNLTLTFRGTTVGGYDRQTTVARQLLVEACVAP